MEVDVLERLDALFVASAIRFPERPAVEIGGTATSYEVLLSQSERIRSAITRHGGTGLSENIGLLAQKSVFGYAAIIGILRGGDAYVPLNPKWPAERCRQVIRDADIRVLVTDLVGELLPVDVFRDIPGLIVLTPSDLPALEGAWRDHLTDPVAPADPESIAYVIYTSGSTGAPKGVALKHSNVAACMRRLGRLFPIRCEDRFTQFPDFSFDLSVSDLFLCWRSGACLVVPDKAQAMLPSRFVTSHNISVWTSVPSLANNMRRVGALRPGSLLSVRLSLFCGEPLPSELAEAWARAAPTSLVVNLYGPTETAVFSSHYLYEPGLCEGAGIVPIGKIFEGLSHRVLDDQGIEADLSQPGELCIGGDQVSVGYWKNAAATRASFFETHDSRGSSMRWYRTGDIVARHEQVGLVFLGRKDRQVKMYGHRVELLEIEGLLRDITGSSVVAVIPVAASDSLTSQLVAFCDAPCLEEAVLKQCELQLPKYMLPTRIIELNTFPLSDNGKIDMRRLNAIAVSILGKAGP